MGCTSSQPAPSHGARHADRPARRRVRIEEPAEHIDPELQFSSVTDMPSQTLNLPPPSPVANSDIARRTLINGWMDGIDSIRVTSFRIEAMQLKKRGVSKAGSS